LKRTGRRLIVTLFVALPAAVFVYLVRAGRTNDWPEAAACAVVSSRVVRADLQSGRYGEPMVGYEGQYGVSYTVNGTEYFTWVKPGWWDVSRQFVADKVANLPEKCPYRVQYNPHKPAESVVHRKAD
jgi:hypothetical protein